MRIHIADSKEEVSKRVANDLIELLHTVKHPLICLASGDSPSGLYKEIVQRVQNKELNIYSWKFVGLDEWVGMNGGDEGSCRYHLDQQFFTPLRVSLSQICFFNGRATDLENECAATEMLVSKNGGIDVAIIGLGLNGHVGMNEPGTALGSRVHIADIDPLTQRTAQKYFSSPKQVTHGLTLGLKNLMEARHIYLIVTGAHKAEIVQKVLEGDRSENVPASLLRNHSGFTIYLDTAAAKLLAQ